MNALHESYASSGLAIVGVSNEGESVLSSWIDKRGPKYPVVNAPSGASKYGVTAFPTYYLVSASGRVLAGPQHGHFSRGQIEDALKSVLVFSPPPKGNKFDKLRKAQDKLEVGAMARELARLIQDPKLTPEEKVAIEAIRGEVTGRTTQTLTEVGALAAGPDYLAASERLAEIAGQFAGTPVEAEVKTTLEKFKKDKAIVAEMRASKELAAYRKRYDAKKHSGKKKLLAALEGFIKKREGTHAAKKAEVLVDKLGKTR